MTDVTLRIGDRTDADAIAAIYRPYVETTAITFEEEPPDSDAIAQRIETTMRQYPWFVAETDGQILGYAYAGSIRKRSAYRWATELSIYLDQDVRGRGIGTALYTALLETLERQGFKRCYGVLTLPNPESVSFHESFGFTRTAVFSNMGYKLGEWHDVAWYERSFNTQRDETTSPIPFSVCRDEPWVNEVLTETSTEIE